MSTFFQCWPSDMTGSYTDARNEVFLTTSLFATELPSIWSVGLHNQGCFSSSSVDGLASISLVKQSLMKSMQSSVQYWNTTSLNWGSFRRIALYKRMGDLHAKLKAV